MFYPPEGGCGSSSQWVQLILFPFYWWWKRYWGVSISQLVICLFETSRMFFPPEGGCGGSFPRGPIDTLSLLLVKETYIGAFGLAAVIRLFENLFDDTGGTRWTGGRSRKLSFKFLHTLLVYRLCICLLVYEIKIVINILMSFKISCQVGDRGQKVQNYSR